MSLFTVQDRRALIVYLRHLEKSHQLAAHLATEHGSQANAIAEASEAEQLAHWADGLEAELEDIRLRTVDRVPLLAIDAGSGAVSVVPEIEGLTNGPVHNIQANPPSDESMFS